ncbi:hypothetical protein K435DRAFT_853507 [Dendrothele bispora CBS 962.96]|uniref:Nucleoplasmin-like domain-containing protein n=1 Tax=Dendrothele bispora (strain CBS 962.96) TaxID=1314807 RepID=A0A4S8MG89_DENBC|nr:hypothetical protein K435DRAFT_853507 [Dendrothele bispora CBS 962.96]
MRYWTYNLEPSSPKVFTPTGVLHITNVAIKDVFDAHSRTVLTLTPPDSLNNGVVAAALTPNCTEFTILNVKLAPNVPIILQADGPNTLSLIGWIEEGPKTLQKMSSLSSASGLGKRQRKSDNEEFDDQPLPKRFQAAQSTDEEAPVQSKRTTTRAAQKAKAK